MWDVDQISSRYREAWRVSRRVPSGIHLGHVSYWPEIKPNRWEVYHAEGKITKLPQPSEDDVDRMVECMRWLRWLNRDERQLVWLRASGMPWRMIAQELGVNRKTPYAHWHKAINRILIHLSQKKSG
ncbi:DUF6362 family protein [Endozoicomonas sp. Mp262]|uniref:DUF6362 family protein n=1 Tax=Endozoicomonas sp. Mp262 TaxID=2919499 RepID=UPI0021D97CFB